MEGKNFTDKNGRRQGYWEFDWDDDNLYCGHYIDAKSIGVWRNYSKSGVLYKTFTLNEPYWTVYYHHDILEYLGGSVLIHEHNEE